MMEIFRAYKVELDLNNKQRALLVQCAGAARWTYNWGLSRRIQEYEDTGKSSNAIEQNRQLNALKKTEYPWLYNYSKSIPQLALQNLDKAYKNFFRRVKSGDKQKGFPRLKSRKRGIGSFGFTGSILVKNERIRLPRVGWLRLKEPGYIPTEGIHTLSATVSEKAGHWFVSILCRKEIDVSYAIGSPVGVDLGIKEMAVCSDGQRFENPKPLRRAQKELSRLQRRLARKERGSKNREKAKAKLAKAHCRIANIRKDSLHKATSAIVAKTKPDNERPSAIVLEDLNVSGMMKNHKLARAISDVGFYEFRRQLEYKSKWCGSDIIIADRFFPSSKLCAACGLVNGELTLKDRTWTCECGTVHDRDLNAAINLSLLATNTASSAGIDACGEKVRPIATPLAVSMKQEPSEELHDSYKSWRTVPTIIKATKDALSGWSR